MRTMILALALALAAGCARAPLEAPPPADAGAVDLSRVDDAADLATPADLYCSGVDALATECPCGWAARGCLPDMAIVCIWGPAEYCDAPHGQQPGPCPIGSCPAKPDAHGCIYGPPAACAGAYGSGGCSAETCPF